MLLELFPFSFLLESLILKSMSDALKKMLFASMGVSGLVALMALVDLIAEFPFAGQRVMDIMFVLTAALVIYMAYDAYKDMK